MIKTIKELLKWLNDNQWLNLIFLLLAIISILVSIYLFFKSKRKKKPKFSIRSINVISDSLQKLEEIQVLYRNTEVKNLTVTKIAIWNEGNDTLNFSDMASLDKLRIVPLNDTMIFSVALIHRTTETNNLQSFLEDNLVTIQFDYLDKNQGGIFKIIHSGKSSNDLEVCGTFKNSGKIKGSKISSLTSYKLGKLMSSILPFSRRSKKPPYQALPWMIFIVGCVTIMLPFVYSTLPEGSTFVMPLAGATYVILAIILLLNDPTLPRNFENFYEDE